MSGRARQRRSRRRRRRFGCALLALALALAGLLLLALVTAVPIAWLRTQPPPTTSFMLIASRADPATGLPCERVEYQWVDRTHISPHLALAVVVAEDQRFLLHRGFDVYSIEQALEERATEGRVRGASTLSQQLAKNLFLWPDKSMLRKALEAWYTLWIEWAWSKPRILEVYLNVAQFGPCVFGAEAASRRFFERSASQLEPEQAALLATVLPSPRRLRAHDPGPYALERRRQILDLMEELRRAPHLRGL
jgi:monofunctional biosynthetic peptidoglycan transglycosylase